MNHTYVISTVGTSLLTNGASDETKAALRNTANKTRCAIDEATAGVVDARVTEARAALAECDAQQARRMSAELNGVHAGGWLGKEYSHYLLHTDTYQGKCAADVISEYLRRHRSRSAEPVCLKDLRTDKNEDFRAGIQWLLHWCDQTLPALRKQQARVVFNLVGGFKALQAYVQTIGMFSADEVCYLFEVSNELIRIPRLPLMFDPKPFHNNAPLFARLAHDCVTVDPCSLPSLPDVYIDTTDDIACLSTWGKLAWDQRKRDILSRDLLEQPGLVYTESFRKDYDREKDKDKRVVLQETLAEVAVLWERGGLADLRNDGGLQYETYQDKEGVGHFRLNQGDRVSCKPVDGILRLRHCGAHDYVNRNP